jgi:uridine phosphorylase
MSKSTPKPSEVAKTSKGRHYHLDLAPGELADYILFCVDPARARRVA